MTTEIHDTHTCPCEMCVWARQTAANKPKSPPETYYGHPRLDTGTDLAVGGAGNPTPDPRHLFQPSEGLNRQETQNRAIPVSGNEQKSVTSAPDNIPGDPERLTRLTIDPYEYLKTFKYPPEQATLDSPALRRTRSILHHAEMVEEQVRRDNCGECSHAKDLHNGDHCCYPLPSRSGVKWCDCKCVFPVQQPPAQMTFEQEWQSAPKSIKHGCEEVSAEFFYHAGRRDRETEMLREVNEVLSGVVGRIERERVR